MDVQGSKAKAATRRKSGDPNQADISQGVRVLERAVDVMESLAGGRMTLSEIAKRVGLAKTTAFRLLSGLESKGLVVKDPLTARYGLSHKLPGFDRHVTILVQDILRAAGPILAHLRDATRETVSLHIRFGLDQICVAEHVSPSPIRYSAGVGARAPIGLLSVGAVLLSVLPPEEMLQIVEVSHAAFRRHFGEQSLELVLNAVAAARENGWSISSSPASEGAAISVPVSLGKNTFLALSIHGPVERLSTSWQMGQLKGLKRAGADIEGCLTA